LNPAVNVKGDVFIFSAQRDEAQGIAAIIAEDGYPTGIYAALPDLMEALRKAGCRAVILDVDSMPLDNRIIRDLKMEFPRVALLCISRDRFHPELKDAISRHIFACLNKPVDPDELRYFLKCIHANHTDSRSPPDTS
jgi:DNA-binding NtrC family response regulator